MAAGTPSCEVHPLGIGGKADPAVREFLRYVLSREGQSALVEESGYLPLGHDIIRREQEKLP